jgi:O-antigen/teichoic acid export membrane protein
MREIFVSKPNRYPRNLFFSALSTTSNLFVFLLGVLAARYLGTEGFGKYAFALTYALLFEIFVNLGLHEIAVREVARDQTKAAGYLGNIIGIKALLSVPTFLALCVLINALGYPPDTKLTVYILGLATLVKSFQLLFRAFFHAVERFELDAITSHLERVATLILGFMVLYLGLGLIYFSAVFLVVRSVNIIIPVVLLTREKIRISIRFNFSLWRQLVYKSIPFAMNFILSMIYFRIDTVMLSLMRGDGEVGLYNAAYQILEGLLIIPRIFSESIFPTLSIFFVVSRIQLTLAFQKGIKYCFLTSLPITISGIILSKKIIILFFGESYQPSSYALNILLISLVFIFMSRLGTTALASVDKQNTVVKISATCGFTNILLNLIVIPHYGFIGASLTTLATEILFFGATFFTLIRSGYAPQFQNIFFKPFIISLIVGAFVLFLRELDLTVCILLSISLFVGLTFLFKVWDSEELEALMRMRRRVISFIPL